MTAAADRSLRHRGAATDLALLTVLWIAAELLIDPRGDFPLNDDWSFGLPTRLLAEGAGFHPTSWSNMTLLTHVAWGALVSLPFGYSLQTLRIATAVWGLAGIVAAWWLIGQVSFRRDLRLVGAFAVGFGPLYVVSSNTFMTDVPFTVMFTLSAIFFLHSLRTRSNAALAAGTILACLATLSRQIGLATPVAFTACLLIAEAPRPRAMARAAIPAVVCLVTFVAFEAWLKASGLRPLAADQPTDVLLRQIAEPLTLLKHTADDTFVALLYFGWFLLPVLLLLPSPSFRLTEGRANRWIITLIGAGVVLWTARDMLSAGGLMPLGSNVIVPQGIGPLTLRDTLILKLPDVPPIAWPFWLVVTIAAVFGATALIAALLAAVIGAARVLRRRGGGEQLGPAFLLLSVALYLLPPLASRWFDRYMLPAMPLLLAALCHGISEPAPRDIAHRFRRPAAVAMLVMTAGFAVLGTKDYLAWNRVRWAALTELTRSGKATAATIDGGYEFNGMYNFATNFQRQPGRSWWWVNDDRYLIAFGPLPGWDILAAYRYRSWLHPGDNRILVLRRPP